MTKVFLTAVIIVTLASCTFSGGERSTSERVLIACTAWSEAFRTSKTRRQFGFASEREIATVNIARPVLNPLCSSDNLAATTESALENIELLLIQVLSAERAEQ